MLRQLTLLVVFWGGLLSVGANVSGGDFVPLEPNRRRPTPKLLLQLEETLLDEPQRVDKWIELIRELEWDGVSWFQLRCYTEAAIRANPESRELLWERLRLLPTLAALDELARLEATEPNRRLVEDHRSILPLGLKPPRDWEDARFYGEWAEALVRRQNWKSAVEVCERGLALEPSSISLNTCYAMALIGHEKYPAAMEVIEKNHYRQSLSLILEKQFPSVSDLLLLKNQPKLAAAAFGPNRSNAYFQSTDGLIYAKARLLAGETDQEEPRYGHTQVLPSAVLKIANLLRLQKEDEARTAADEFLGLLLRFAREQNFRHTLEIYGAWPISLHEDFTRSITWLYATYPKRHDFLKAHLPLPVKLFAVGRPENLTFAEAGQSIMAASERKLQRLALQPLDDKFDTEVRLRQARRETLGRMLLVQTSHGNYRASADLWSRLRELEMPHETARSGLPNIQRIVLLLRQADTLPIYTAQPAELFAARQLLMNLRARRENLSLLKQQSWLTDDEVVARAEKLGPSILPLVYESLDLQNLPRQDRAAEARIIAQLGSQRDVPLLIAAFRHDGTSYQRLDKPNTPEEIEREELTLKALNLALEKLTGEQCDSNVTSSRLEFWLAWWNKHEAEFLRGK